MTEDSVGRVVDGLSADIAALQPGDRLPSEQTIMTRFGVTRSTTRAALSQLEARYLVRRVQGSGTFVHRRIDYVISRTRRPSIHETIAQAGAVARTFLLEATEAEPPPGVAQRMGAAEGSTLHRLQRLGYIDDVVAFFSVEWVARQAHLPLQRGLAVTESLDELLRTQRFDPYRAWCRATIAVPPADAADRLEIDGHVHTWRVDSLSRNRTDGAALLLSRTWTRQDLVRMVLELDDPGAPEL